MVSCITVESLSLAFASLSMLFSCMGTFMCVALMVHSNVLMAYLLSNKKFEILMSNYILYNNIGVSVVLAIGIVATAFSIILIKGLLTKKSHLVKAYFVYGATTNTISVILALISAVTVNFLISLLSLFGCFFYCIILIVIRRTYEKLASTDCDQFCHKKLESEQVNP